VHILERRVMRGSQPVSIFPNLLGDMAFYRFERLK
jgi:hypothetical protein